MPPVSGREGHLDCLVTGSGTPVTVFAHGFASSIDETRPFGSGVAGRRVFFHFRGHGASHGVDGPWTYAGLEAQLAGVRDVHDATRGLGVSLGAGAVLRLAVHRPGVFDGIVLVLPASVDEPRSGKAVDRVEAMAQRAYAGDVDGLTQLLLAEQPQSVRSRRVVQVWARNQAQRLSGDGLRPAIRQIPMLYPLEDRSDLAGVGCPVLLIGQEDDEAHPSRVVHELAEGLPAAQVEIFTPGGVLWTHRGALRRLVSSFLNT